MRKTSLQKQLTLDIEREYYKQAQGKQIDIMKICDFFDDCARAVMQDGQTVADAVAANIEKYCTNAD